MFVNNSEVCNTVLSVKYCTKFSPQDLSLALELYSQEGYDFLLTLSHLAACLLKAQSEYDELRVSRHEGPARAITGVA